MNGLSLKEYASFLRRIYIVFTLSKAIFAIECSRSANLLPGLYVFLKIMFKKTQKPTNKSAEWILIENKVFSSV